MPNLATLDLGGTPAKPAPVGPRRGSLNRRVASPARTRRVLPPLLVLGALSAVCPGADAVDGCTVLLCLAAPKWSAVPPCVAPVRALFHDLARGRSFPKCKMGGDDGKGTDASNAWAVAPTRCPPQYTHELDIGPGPLYRCDYVGAVSIVVDGALFARTWWSPKGDSVTEFTPTAKAQLGTWDPQFDIDYARWRATRPAAAPVDSR